MLCEGLGSFRKKTYVRNYFVEHSIRNVLDTLQEIETSNPKQLNMRCAEIVIVISKKVSNFAAGKTRKL